MERIWVPGGADSEMTIIEALLRKCGERVEYATVYRDGVRRRVTPAEAYAPDVEIGAGLRGLRATAYMVECAPAVLVGSSVDGIDWAGGAVTIDHHRPGDPGYGRPPAEFLPASSIGQVIRELARLQKLQFRPLTKVPGAYPGGSFILRNWEGSGPDWLISDGTAWRVVPPHFVLAAASDHCLAHAYAGECPGVDPDALMRWRAETRAASQKRSVEEILADIEVTRTAFPRAPTLDLGGEPVKDFREAYTVTTALVAPFAEGATVDAAGVGDDRYVVFGPRDTGAWDEGGHHVFVAEGAPELPEAACREGITYLATVADRDGRKKVVLGGAATPEVVKTFLDSWAPSQGLVDTYGDPARGFAGGYLPAG